MVCVICSQLIITALNLTMLCKYGYCYVVVNNYQYEAAMDIVGKNPWCDDVTCQFPTVSADPADVRHVLSQCK